MEHRDVSDLAGDPVADPDPALGLQPGQGRALEPEAATLNSHLDDIARAFQSLRERQSPGSAADVERKVAGLKNSLSSLLAARRDKVEHLVHDQLRLQVEFKAALARADALERELRATRQVLRARDTEIQAIRHSLGWLLVSSGRGLVNVLRGKLSIRAAALHGARTIYRQLPLSDATRRRVGERALEAIRLFRAARAPLSMRKPAPLPRARAQQSLPFPLAGSITVLPELLVDEPPPAVDASISVVIPTYNAGREFHWLLRKLRAQRGLREVEIVVVDSGSTDGTVERAQEAGCKVVRIEKAEFSHSFARNLGAEHASGDLLLFTVQDAYPVGDHWLCTLARCLLHPRCEEERLAAVSCAEFPRSDTELLYNALINTHYRFLRCHDGDRIGQLTDRDNLSLRIEGQLSDVACLMERSIFERYMYHGRYAEDLILGIRLIRDGHRVGMLSSVKVIHSHTRPVGYHVRRVFVDVVFLSDVFPDFATPEATSVVGTFAAACLIRERLTPVKPSLHRSAAAALGDVIGSIRELALPHLVPDLTGRADFEFPPLGAWVESIARDESRVGSPMTAADKREAERMRSMCLDRLAHLRSYLEEAAPVLDESVARELTDAVEKTLAMALGTQLAFICLTAELDPKRATNPRVAELKPMLVAGI